VAGQSGSAAQKHPKTVIPFTRAGLISSAFLRTSTILLKFFLNKNQGTIMGKHPIARQLLLVLFLLLWPGVTRLQ